VTRLARSLVVALMATLALAGLATPAHAAENHAVVIIATRTRTYTQVISFSGSISGLQALSLAGASPVTTVYGGQGYAVCKLFDEGNDPDSCLGTPSDPTYWAYFRAPAGQGGWQYSGAGASATTVNDGDVEGWGFGRTPGFQSFCSVVGCGPPPAPDPAPAPAPSGGGTASAPVAGGTGSAPAAGLPTGAAARTDPATAAGSDAAGTDPTVTVPPTTRAAADSPRDTRRTDTRALGARPVVADDGGSGSPVGVLVALGLVAVIAGVAVVLRRRGRASG